MKTYSEIEVPGRFGIRGGHLKASQIVVTLLSDEFKQHQGEGK